MTARLDIQPARNDFSLITAGATVRAPTWQDASQAINYVRSKGAVLIPAMQLNYTVSAGTSATFRFRVAPGTISKAACWLISLKSGSAVAQVASVQVPSGATAINQTASTLYAAGSTGIYFDTATAVTSYAERELTFVVTAPAAGSVIVGWAACYETPRQFLALDATEEGVDLQSILPTQPIVESTGRSFWQIASATQDALANDSRRCGFYHWFSPTGFASASTSYTSPIRSFPILNRKLFGGETQRNMRFRVYASATTNTGDVRLTSSKGGTSTVSVAVGAAAWYPSTAGAAATLLVDSEDLSTADGLQGGTYNTVTTEIKINTAGAITLYGVSVFEDPADCA